MPTKSTKTPARKYAKGMGEAVANRTINRKIRRKLKTPELKTITLPRRDDISLDKQLAEYCLSNGYVIDSHLVTSGDDQNVDIEISIVEKDDVENWKDVAKRVAEGNTLMHPADKEVEYPKMLHHLRQASVLMSGRHLQHGDETQPSRPGEVYTNCSTSAMSFLTFLLLLSGSGVGRCYDDDMMIVDWGNLPIIVPTIDGHHADCLSGEITALDRRAAQHLYSNRDIFVHEVEDSREGWAKSLEAMEIAAYKGNLRESVMIIDFSKVRPRGSPILGMQNRPASGPGPLIGAIKNVAQLREAGMEPWRAAMYVDHYVAECVLVGGARRAARMATKTWRDKNVIDFVNVKRPLEFYDKSGEEIVEIKKTKSPQGFLWSSNNSVTVDSEFWRLVNADWHDVLHNWSYEDRKEAEHAKNVFNAICEASYFDGTGEPGLINQDMLTQKNEGFEVHEDGRFAGSSKYQLDEGTLNLAKDLSSVVLAKKHSQITNPCGEITLNMLGGYCVIGDVVPYHAQSDDDAEDAFRVTTKSLMRTNLMEFLYDKEVKRTNRIGVGITGFHEWVWERFNYGWKDIVNEEVSKPMWLMLSRFKRAIVQEAKSYAQVLGVNVPHTDTTIKPAGTTSKLFGLTEGAHLPSMREFIRWVQFRNDDPLIDDYRKKGYPVKKLQSYSGTTIVGFPTQPEICKLGMGDNLVTAAEATPEEQYEYLRLMEKYWIRGVEEDGVTPLAESGNQVSYTLKYDPSKVSYEQFKKTLLEGQSKIRCCSVMPQTDSSAYEYQPEEPTTKSRYQQICQAIQDEDAQEDIGQEHVDCSSGACPISFNENR